MQEGRAPPAPLPPSCAPLCTSLLGVCPPIFLFGQEAITNVHNSQIICSAAAPCRSNSQRGTSVVLVDNCLENFKLDISGVWQPRFFFHFFGLMKTGLGELFRVNYSQVLFMLKTTKMSNLEILFQPSLNYYSKSLDSTEILYLFLTSKSLCQEILLYL